MQSIDDITHQKAGTRDVRILSDIVLAPDGSESGDDPPVVMDLFYPHAGRQKHATSPSPGHVGLPFVILMPGAAGPKDLFTMASTKLAHAGYAVAVASQLQDYTGTPVEDILVCINYTDSCANARAAPCCYSDLHTMIANFCHAQ